MNPGFLTLVFLGLFPAVQAGEIPAGVPHISGIIREVTGADSTGASRILGQILVEEQRHGEILGLSKAVVTVTTRTRIYSNEMKVVDFGHLKRGESVRVWFSGEGLLSYPMQSVGRVIVVGAPKSAVFELPRPIRVGSRVQAKKLIKRVEPEYPEEARKQGVEGLVLLEVVVDKEGAVIEVQKIRGHRLLVDAAREAVKQWRYRPTFFAGNPVSVRFTVTIVFRTDQR